jgi:hypothetical protein
MECQVAAGVGLNKSGVDDGWTMTSTNVSKDSIGLLCNHCGKTFSAFLHQMADQNAKVACPDCREGDCKPAKAKPGAAKRLAKKMI